MRVLAIVGLSVVLMIVGGAGSAASQATPPTGERLDRLTAEVASQLRCPVCRQLSVQDSEAELSKEVKVIIRERLAAGESPEEVKAYFVSKYGEWILLSPPKRGFTLLVWVLPLVGILGGGLILTLLFRSWLGVGQNPTGTAMDVGQH